jgi:serine protease SohB
MPDSPFTKALAKLPFAGPKKPLVNVVRLEGVITSGTRPGKDISAQGAEKPLRRAFTRGKPRAVVLAVNSPGGAPAQSRMIHDRARGLAAQHGVPVIAYAEDVAASGGYMIALAGDEILADPFAIVGSVGVISASFGFQDAIGRIGVERRVHTAGENKSQLDPFRREDPDDVARLEELLDKSHTLFKAMVRERRGARLTYEDILDGRYWIAGDAVELGLIDGVGDLRTILKDRYGKDVRIKTYGQKESGLFSRLLSGRLGLDWDAMLDAVEARAARGRFGL